MIGICSPTFWLRDLEQGPSILELWSPRGQKVIPQFCEDYCDNNIDESAGLEKAASKQYVIRFRPESWLRREANWFLKFVLGALRMNT